MRLLTNITKKQVIIVSAIVLFIVLLFFGARWFMYEHRPFDPLPSEVMTTASNSTEKDLWLQYLSFKDSIGNKAQFQDMLKKRGLNERQFALVTLKEILQDQGAKDIDSKANKCLEENFKG